MRKLLLLLLVVSCYSFIAVGGYRCSNVRNVHSMVVGNALARRQHRCRHLKLSSERDDDNNDEEEEDS